MKAIDFNNKIFSLVTNTDNGKVTAETIFEYKQEGDMVTANYYGGTIRYGKIIAILQNRQLNMLYQCLTTSNELKAGKAMADISFTENGKMKLNLNWEWLGSKNDKGVSEYLEN